MICDANIGKISLTKPCDSATPANKRYFLFSRRKEWTAVTLETLNDFYKDPDFVGVMEGWDDDAFAMVAPTSSESATGRYLKGRGAIIRQNLSIVEDPCLSATVVKLVSGNTYHAIATTNSTDGRNKICVWENSQGNPQTFPFTFLSNTPTGTEMYGDGSTPPYNVLLWDRGDHETYIRRRRFVDGTFQDDEVIIPQVAEVRPLGSTQLQLIDCYKNPITAIEEGDVEVSVTVNGQDANATVASVSADGVITLAFPTAPAVGARIVYNVTVTGDVIITDPVTFIVASPPPSQV